MQINFIQQFKHYGKLILLLVLFFNLVILAAWGISYANSLPLNYLLEDPASLIGFDQFIGFVTPVGAIVLAAGIGAGLLMAYILPSQPDKQRKREVEFVLLLCLVSLFLVADDLFLLHERVFTGWFQVGERRIFLVYILIFALFMVVFKENFLTGPTLFLVISALLFAASIASDFVTDKVGLSAIMTEILEMMEEGCKLSGYLFWTAYIFIKARNCVVGNQ